MSERSQTQDSTYYGSIDIEAKQIFTDTNQVVVTLRGVFPVEGGRTGSLGGWDHSLLLWEVVTEVYAYVNVKRAMCLTVYGMR